mmetsp:Transcript_19124/g.43466  ORF Transcript_19124/g.43466 Transcript_19124/m.43466 type:complete len:242 (-) Transcript_19124:22-747(-)
MRLDEPAGLPGVQSAGMASGSLGRGRPCGGPAGVAGRPRQLAGRPALMLGAIGCALLGVSEATVRMPEEFNVQTDFAEKEKWRRAQPHIRCELCQLTVRNTFDAVGENFNEDDVYDHIDKICDVEKLFDSHEIRELPLDNDLPPGSGGPAWELVEAGAASSRSALTLRWQTHAMKELCDNVIKPNDDEIKDSLLKAARKRRREGAVGSTEGRDAAVRGACERIRLCRGQGKAGAAGARQDL